MDRSIGIAETSRPTAPRAHDPVRAAQHAPVVHRPAERRLRETEAGFNRLIERIERVAIASDAPILLTGPTGYASTWRASD